MDKLFFPELTNLKLGYIPLTDCAPVVVAKEFGFFEKWGLNVELKQQSSWQTLKSELTTGQLDAAQLLAPMPIASSLGLDGLTDKMIAPMVLSRNGNAITLSSKLYEALLDLHRVTSLSLPLNANVLNPHIKQLKADGKKLKFATVYQYSCHYYQLLSWLKISGINSDIVDVVILSPCEMVSALASGDIDGFCVGGPWNAQAVRSGHGVTCATSSDIWGDSPEKVLGVMADWQQRNPETTFTLIAALTEACQWLENIPNRFEAATLLASERYLDADIDVIAPSLLGSCLTRQGKPPRIVPSYNQFSARQDIRGNKPDSPFGQFLLNQMSEAGHLPPEIKNSAMIGAIYREDIYQAVVDMVAPSSPKYVSMPLSAEPAEATSSF